MLVERIRFSRSEWARLTSSTLFFSSLFTVVNSSFTDCSSSLLVSNSSAVERNSSLMACSSSLEALSSSVEVSFCSMVFRSRSLVCLSSSSIRRTTASMALSPAIIACMDCSEGSFSVFSSKRMSTATPGAPTGRTVILRRFSPPLIWTRIFFASTVLFSLRAVYDAALISDNRSG